jgi:hypothetical protein
MKSKCLGISWRLWSFVAAASLTGCSGEYEESLPEHPELATIAQPVLEPVCEDVAEFLDEDSDVAACDPITLWDLPIPYEFVNHSKKQELLDAMNEWKSVVGGMELFRELDPGDVTTPRVKFVETGGKGCKSAVGKDLDGDDVQEVKLLNCNTRAKRHELGHLLGFIHKQIRSDRERYLTVRQGEHCDPTFDDACDADEPFCITGQYFKASVLRCSTAGPPQQEGLIGPFELASIMEYGSDLFLDGTCTATNTADCKLLDRNGIFFPTNNTVTVRDGSNLLEHYAVQRGWTVFQPIYRADTNSTAPMDLSLRTSGVKLNPSHQTAALARWATSDLVVLALGDDAHIYSKVNPGSDTSWPSGDWADIGGDFASRPAAVSWAANRLDVVATGTNNNVYHRWYLNGWGPSWSTNGLGRPPGTASVSAPAVASWGPDRLDIFVRTGQNIYQKSWTSSGWSATWADRGCCFKGDPAAVSWGPNRIDVVGIGTDNAVWHRAYTGTWNGNNWSSIGGQIKTGTGPAIASEGVNKLNVYAVGAVGGRLYHNAWASQTWTGWLNIGGLPTGSPAAFTQTNGRAHVAIGTSNRSKPGGSGYDGIWHRYWE